MQSGAEALAVTDQRPCGEFRSWPELANDALTRMVLRADGVDPETFAALLRHAAETHRIAKDGGLRRAA
jgi:hypothetical protein